MGALILKGSRILIVQRAGQPLRGWWSLPGGLVETGEKIEDAVRREVFEETGLNVRLMRMAGVFERIIRDRRGRAEYHYVLIDYICRVAGGELRPGSDVSHAAWATRQELSKYKLTEGTLDFIRTVWKQRTSSNSKR